MRFLAILLTILTATGSPGGQVLAQQTAAGAVTPPPTAGLTINVLEGEGGRNSIKRRFSTPVKIEVRDGQSRPVVGAQVIFRLPSLGASGSFPGGELVERTTTGPSGEAVMSGFVPNDIEGRFGVKVTADSGTLSGSAVIYEWNVAELATDKKTSSHAALWILVAAGAAGAVGAGVALGGKGGGSAPPPSPSVTVSAGAITVGK